ncbi:SHOCT domain-containing protein [Humibacter ginsenosidimutans]|uniref:SHOCT domain-containing protein n=1 Tax=Humibacter ginsenosidimutans TaxID=2599293 RepID=UPI00143DE16D|nr:SHOCT domain-containing protein [Humibacter ginsenosidimutans]
MNRRRTTWRVLGILGLALTVAGIVIWAVAKGAIDREQSLYWFTHTLSSKGYADSAGLVAASVWQWIGVAAIVIGTVTLVTVCIAAAVSAGDGTRPWFDIEAIGAERMRHQHPVSLTQLAALHERGALTDEEFTAAKRVLLGL